MDHGPAGGSGLVDCICELLAEAGSMHDGAALSKESWAPRSAAAAGKKGTKIKKREIATQGRVMGFEDGEGSVVGEADVGVLPYFPPPLLPASADLLKRVVNPVLPRELGGNSLNGKKKFFRGVYLVALASLGGHFPRGECEQKTKSELFTALHRCCRCIDPKYELMGKHVMSNEVLNYFPRGDLQYAVAGNTTGSVSAFREYLRGLPDILDGIMFTLLGLQFSDMHEDALLLSGTEKVVGALRGRVPNSTTIAPVFPILAGNVNRLKGKTGVHNIFRFTRLHAKHSDFCSAGFLCYRHALEKFHGANGAGAALEIPSWLATAAAPGSHPHVYAPKGKDPVLVAPWIEAFLDVSVVCVLRLSALLALQDLFHFANICGALGPDNPACSRKCGNWESRDDVAFVGAVLRPYAGPHYEARGWDVGCFDQLFPGALMEFSAKLADADQFTTADDQCLPVWAVILHRAWPKVRNLFDSIGIAGAHDEELLKEVVARGVSAGLNIREQDLRLSRLPQLLTHDPIGFRRFFDFVNDNASSDMAVIKECNTFVGDVGEKSSAVGVGSLMLSVGCVLLEDAAIVLAGKDNCSLVEGKRRAGKVMMAKFYRHGHQMGSWNEHAVTEGDKLQKSAALCSLCYETHPCSRLVKPPPSEWAIPANIARFVCLFTSDVEYYDTSDLNTEVALDSGAQLTAQQAASLPDDAVDDVECDNFLSAEVNVAEQALGASEGMFEGGSQENLASAVAVTSAAGTIGTAGDSCKIKSAVEGAGQSSSDVVELNPILEREPRDHGSAAGSGPALVTVLPDYTTSASNGKGSLALDDADYGVETNAQLREADDGSARDCEDVEEVVGETAALINSAVQTGTVGGLSDSHGSGLEILAETAASTSASSPTAKQGMEVEPISPVQKRRKLASGSENLSRDCAVATDSITGFGATSQVPGRRAEPQVLNAIASEGVRVKWPKLKVCKWSEEDKWWAIHFSKRTKFKPAGFDDGAPAAASNVEGRVCAAVEDLNPFIHGWPACVFKARKVFSTVLPSFNPLHAFLEDHEKSGRAVPSTGTSLPTDFASGKEFCEYHASLLVIELDAELRLNCSAIKEELLSCESTGKELDSMVSLFTRVHFHGFNVLKAEFALPKFVPKSYPGLPNSLPFSLYQVTVSVGKEHCSHPSENTEIDCNRFERSCRCAGRAVECDFVQVRLQSIHENEKVLYDGSLWEIQRHLELYKLVGFVTKRSEFHGDVVLEICLFMPDNLWNLYSTCCSRRAGESWTSNWFDPRICGVHVTIIASCDQPFADLEALSTCCVEEAKLNGRDHSSRLSTLAQTIGSRMGQADALQDEFNDLTAVNKNVIREVCAVCRLDEAQSEIVTRLVHAYQCSGSQALTPVVEGGAGTGKSRVMAALFKCLIELHISDEPMRIATAVASNRGCEAMLQKLTKDGLRVVFVSSSKHLSADLAANLAVYRSANLALDSGNATPTPWRTSTLEGIALKSKVDRDLLHLRANWRVANGQYKAAESRLEILKTRGCVGDNLLDHAECLEKYAESLERHVATKELAKVRREVCFKALQRYVNFSAHVYVGTPSGLCSSADLNGEKAYPVQVLACDEVGQMRRMDIFCLSAMHSLRESRFTVLGGDMKQMVHRLPVPQAQLYQYGQVGLQNVLQCSLWRKFLSSNGTPFLREFGPACAYRLNVNYRSAPEIVGLTSEASYGGEMQASSFGSIRSLAEYFVCGNVAYVDCVGDPSCRKTAYVPGGIAISSTLSKKNAPKTNDGQVRRAVDFVETLAITCAPEFFGLSASDGSRGERRKMSVRILSSHVGGARHARELVRNSDILRGSDVEAATVDSYEGGEADVVIYMTIEAGRVQAKQDTAFSACPRRGLVGLTRGKFVTTVFGDSDFHCQCSDPFWGEVFSHCREKGHVWTAEEFDGALKLGCGPTAWARNEWGPR